MDISWDLSNPAYGGTSATGTRTVYAQWRDRSGKWSQVSTDSIVVDSITPTSYVSGVTADNPAGYWRLGETSGATAVDSTGGSNGSYVNGATLGAPSLLASDSGNAAARFDGVNDFVAIPNTTALSLTSAVTVEAWVKPSAIPASGAFATVVTKAEAYSLQFNGPRLEFTIIQSGVRHRVQAAAGAVTSGNIYHVVGTYDGSTQRLYINGSQAASAGLTGAISTNTNPVRIASWDGSGEYLSGVVDEVAIYSTALSSARVANHYANGTSGTTPPTNQTLTVTVNGNGHVTSDPINIDCQPACSASWPTGTTVTLTAGAYAGSTFSGWGGACSCTATCVVTLNGSTNVTGTFTPNPSAYTLTVTFAGNGSGVVTSDVGGIRCPGTCSASFTSGSVVTLTATPSAGNAFSNWTGACSGSDACTVKMLAATSVGAKFRKTRP
jgi:hypothetical protein